MGALCCLSCQEHPSEGARSQRAHPAGSSGIKAGDKLRLRRRGQVSRGAVPGGPALPTPGAFWGGFDATLVWRRCQCETGSSSAPGLFLPCRKVLSRVKRERDQRHRPSGRSAAARAPPAARLRRAGRGRVRALRGSRRCRASRPRAAAELFPLRLCRSCQAPAA